MTLFSRRKECSCSKPSRCTTEDSTEASPSRSQTSSRPNSSEAERVPSYTSISVPSYQAGTTFCSEENLSFYDAPRYRNFAIKQSKFRHIGFKKPKVPEYNMQPGDEHCHHHQKDRAMVFSSWLRQRGCPLCRIAMGITDEEHRQWCEHRDAVKRVKDTARCRFRKNAGSRVAICNNGANRA